MHNRWWQGDPVPSVMNHGDARHFGPYERLGSNLSVDINLNKRNGKK
jgi:hypothetical protein